MPLDRNTWYGSGKALLIFSVLLPPVGFVLLWGRSGTGIFKKLLMTVPILLLGVFYFHLIFGIRIELEGSATRPIVSIHKPERHFDAIEKDRAERKVKMVQAASVRAEKGVAPQGVIGSKLSTLPDPVLPPSAFPRPYWTDFRGPNRDGYYWEMGILTDWPVDGPAELWRQKVGGGYASMVVAEGMIFTIEQRRDREVVAAYELETGQEIWADSWQAFFQETMGGDGPRATPTWHKGRLYALGAMGEFRCLDAGTGQVLWRVNILEDNGAENLNWGMAASPLIVDDKVIVLPGGRSGKSVVAYDKLTGKPVWKSLSDKAAYASPMLVTFAGRRQILAVSARRVMGLAIDDGSLLWDYEWNTAYDVNATQPILLDENRIFISAGYGHGAALVEVRQEGSGYAVREVWKNNRMKNKFTSSVLFEGHIYGLDESILVCLDVTTGERKWKAGRYGYGQVILADGHLIVTAESGEVVLIRATPERHEELVRFSALKGKTWNNPAIVGGRLLVRNTTQMAAYDITSR